MTQRIQKSVNLTIPTLDAINEMRGLTPFSTFVEAIIEDFVESMNENKDGDEE